MNAQSLNKNGNTLDDLPTLAFLGIGLMGAPMAKRLVDAHFPLIVWNRTVQKAEELQAYGAQLAMQLEQTAPADIFITMLAAGPEVKATLESLAPYMKPGSLVIDMSSTQQAEAIELAATLSLHGLEFIDAPVSGGVVGAQAGTLAIMVGASAANYARALPILEHLGRPSHVGPVGCGQLSKLCNQLIVGATLNVVAEALLLAQAGGADPAAVRTALRGGFAESKILEVHGHRMLDRDFMPGGQAKTQAKDMANILKAAREHGIQLPLAELVAEHYDQLAGFAPHVDQSGILLQLERNNIPNRVGSLPDQLPD